jgi:hypothetical protein
MLLASQIDPGHLGSNHGQPFHFDFVVGKPGSVATDLHPVIRLSNTTARFGQTGILV